MVAARLAESASCSVLLVEAGPDRRGEMPAALCDGWTIERETFDWGYVSASEPPKPVRRKRVVGGTSWLTRFTPRGGPADYEGWVALGNSGWGWEDVLPYFVRLETDTDFGFQPWHGDRGPMPSSRFFELEHSPICEAAVEALQSVGFAGVDDHNRPGAVGAGRMPMNVRDGIRVTTAGAYLPVGATPPNLTICPDAQVDAVLFDAGAQASGVRLLDGTTIVAGWVVLCAGTYGSPPILLRSGVGPAQHLREFGIEVVADLPGVGANLADHPEVIVDCGYRGPVRTTPVLHTITTFHSSGRSTSETPDLMFWFDDPSEDDPTFEIEVVLLRPRSRGSVRLRSAAPGEAPVIELPSLTDPSDIERLAEGYRRALDVANRPELRHHCGGAAPAEPDDLEALIRAEHYSIPHVVGTCAMGPEPDEGAVVDASGNVYGTARLSVVDASTMPEIPSGFVHIPTIMIAERLSEQIGSSL